MTLPLFKKIITRDLSIFSLQMWTLGYLEIKKAFSDGYNIAGGLKRHDTFDIYRAESEHAATLNAFLDAFLNQPENFKRIAEQTLAAVKNIRNLIQQTNLDHDQLKKLVDLYIGAWPGIIATYYLPNAIQENDVKLTAAQKADLNFSNGIRLKTEGYYDRVDGYILNKLKNENPGLSENLLKLVSLEEFLNQKILDETVLHQRQTSAVINGKIIPFNKIEETVSNLGYELEKISVNKNISTLKGQIAFKGKVTGAIKLVFNKSEINKVVEGDILVAPMTTPDYLPAMKLASAFVTDEGGVLCHAAIVAREMKKPCLIATKTATEIFTDGDIVEVDAETGVVRLLQ